MNITDITKVHCIGIGGIGVSAIAKFFLSHGARVTGSDMDDSVIVRELVDRGANVSFGHAAENVPQDTDMIVYSSAVPEENPERVRAEQLEIPLFEYSEVLGELMKDRYGIAVSGTNGKTTTTALLGKILEEAGVDPFVIVGGRVPGWDGNVRLSKKKNYKEAGALPEIFVAEGCEYRRHILSLAPKMIVLTNIEADHLDYYRDLEDIKDAFREYIKKLPVDGYIIVNADDPVSREVSQGASVECLTYGIENRADLRAKNIVSVPGGQVFELEWKGTSLGEFSIQIPGRFNVSNALAAACAALLLGKNASHIRSTLRTFSGTWRRFERVGEVGDTTIVSDYAHHPTAVAGTIKAAREFYPKKNMLVVFQPHQRDRTARLLSEFASAFDEADRVLIPEIYQVSGRNEADIDIRSEDLVEAIRERGRVPIVETTQTLSETKERILEQLPELDVVLILGAGSVDSVARDLVSGHREVEAAAAGISARAEI